MGKSISPLYQIRHSSGKFVESIIISASKASACLHITKHTISMSELITRLDHWLRENRPIFYASLSVGATPDEIKELEQCIGAPLPPLYSEMLKWRNGQTEEATSALHDMYTYMSTTDVIATVETMRDLRENDESFDDATWNIKWIPFLDNGSGDNICIDFYGSFGGKSGQVIEYIHDDYPRPILYPSIEVWLKTLVEALEADLYKEDGFLFVPRSDKNYSEFMTEHNFGYPIATPSQST